MNSDAQKDLEEIHFSTMMVTTPKKTTTIQTIQTTNGQLSRGAKKHGASPRKTPRKKKKNRRSVDFRGDDRVLSERVYVLARYQKRRSENVEDAKTIEK